MKKIAQIVVALLFTASTPSITLADSQNATYVLAHAAYKKGDCKTALPAFVKYLKEDETFLSTRSDFKTTIQAAIDHCRYLNLSGPGDWVALSEEARAKQTAAHARSAARMAEEMAAVAESRADAAASIARDAEINAIKAEKRAKAMRNDAVKDRAAGVR